jgi:type VI secretion system protein ImpH
MASPVGAENPDLTPSMEAALAEVREVLFRDPWTFDFFQSVRLLERLQPGRSPVGRYANPRDEIVRFGANPSLSFPASAIQGLHERVNACPAMEVNFFGLVGPLGVMPRYITELTAARVRLKDRTLLDFLDIFNHRLISFFYQAWEKHHFTVGYERDRQDPVTACLFALVGLGTPGLRQRRPVPDESFIYYSGLFGLAPKSAVGIESVISDYFDVPVELEPFVGTWRSLGSQDQCIFGESPEATVLGFGAVVGDEIWDQQSRVRLKIGPLSAGRYGDFLPNGSAWRELRAITRAFCGNDQEFEVQLILRREDVPAPALRGPVEGGLRLGWHTWMKSGPRFGRDPEDTILLLTENRYDAI